MINILHIIQMEHNKNYQYISCIGCISNWNIIRLVNRGNITTRMTNPVELYPPFLKSWNIITEISQNWELRSNQISTWVINFKACRTFHEMCLSVLPLSLAIQMSVLCESLKASVDPVTDICISLSPIQWQWLLKPIAQTE